MKKINNNPNKLNLGFFAENGLTGAAHGERLRKLKLKEDFLFNDNSFKTLKKNHVNVLKALINFLIIIFKYKFPPSIIAAKYLHLDDLRKTRNSKIDTLYIDSLHIAFLLKNFNSNKIIVSVHNYDPDYLLELSRLENSVIKSFFYKYESAISKIIIRQLAKNPKIKIWALTLRDFQSLADLLGSENNLKLIPHQLPVYKNTNRQISKDYHKKINLLFMGGGSHAPNIEALDFILKILDEDERFFANILGSSWQRKPHPRIKYHGYIEDLSTFFLDDFLFICPVFSGSGINMKIFTAIEHGLPGILSEFTKKPFDVYKHRFPNNNYIALNSHDPKIWSNAILEKYFKDRE